ncbi:MAG: hypothetical protein JNM59_12980 [Hyphomonadaceae bacterium]|nr:hypothetical protein [Hyphomonadaceae bacterium]
MPRPKPVPLREVANTPVDEAAVIDAKYRVVGRKRRILRALWRGVLAIVVAATIGFLIPPAWVVIQAVAAWLAEQ